MKASSESGLWAMVISRISTAVLLIRIASRLKFFELQPDGEPPPTCHNSCCRSNLENFSQNKPVKPVLHSKPQGMSVGVEPAQPTCEKQNLSQKASGQSAQECFLPT